MSERQTHSPEANSQTIDELYQQAADYLETMLYTGKASIQPGIAPYALKVRADIPELAGKSIHLEYDRFTKGEDPTQVDRDIPLAYTDESGRNHWHTPIGIKVIGSDGSILHNYDVLHSVTQNGRVAPAMAYDKKMQPHQKDPDEFLGITSLDAKNLIGHIEWALENQAS